MVFKKHHLQIFLTEFTLNSTQLKFTEYIAGISRKLMLSQFRPLVKQHELEDTDPRLQELAEWSSL